MPKSNYIELTKIYDFMEQIEDKQIFMSNVTYFKNPTVINQEQLKQKFENYFSLEKKTRQNFKNKKNIEGYYLKILVSPILVEKDNKKKLRNYVDKVIELITDIPPDKLKWVASKEKTKGGSVYLEIYFIDRVIYLKPKEIIKTYYINQKTGKFAKSTDDDIIAKEFTKEIYFSDKIRFRLGQCPNKDKFIELIEILKVNVYELEQKLFKNITKLFYSFRKQTLKKKVEKNGKTYYVNNHDNLFQGINEEYKRRFTRAYNMFINTLNLNVYKIDSINIKEIDNHLKELRKQHLYNIENYENAIDYLIKLLLYDSVEFLQKFQN